MHELHLSDTDRWIAGVAGGMAETYGVDSLVVRLLWVAAGIAVAPAAIIVYVVLWLALKDGARSVGRSSAVRIAEERYARGEIDTEQLRQIKRDLGAA